MFWVNRRADHHWRCLHTQNLDDGRYLCVSDGYSFYNLWPFAAKKKPESVDMTSHFGKIIGVRLYLFMLLLITSWLFSSVFVSCFSVTYWNILKSRYLYLNWDIKSCFLKIFFNVIKKYLLFVIIKIILFSFWIISDATDRYFCSFNYKLT